MQFRTAAAVVLAATIGIGLAAALDKSTPSKEPAQPKPNPFLSSPTYGVVHWDPAQTDSFPYPVPLGRFHVDLAKAPGIVRGPVNLSTLASASRDAMWVLSSEGVAYFDVSRGGFKEVARIPFPSAKVLSAATHEKALGSTFTTVEEVEHAVREVYGLDWTRITNDVYALVDNDDVVFTNDSEGTIDAFTLVDRKWPTSGIQLLRSYDTRKLLGKSERLVGLNLTYDGKLVVVGERTVAILDRGFTGDAAMVRFGSDETISNGIAVDENGGIYVASDKIMRKLVWTGSELTDDEARGAWSSPYEGGREPPSVKFGTGTGSTPTLMGFGEDADKLVVITDGADKMNLVAFWRDAIPEDAKEQPGAKSRRVAGQIPVRCGLSPQPEFIQSEQSVVVLGYGAFVVNNVRDKGVKDRLVDVIAGGPVLEPAKGCERFEWDPATRAWRSAWSRADVVSTSMVPAVSRPSRIVVVNGYTDGEGWAMTGMDWATGVTVHKVTFGKDNAGNGAYALIQYLPNGDLLFNGLAGTRRVKLTASE